ncbi:hypothetical protein [Aquisphaera insulae]|uniref:hypothetical protein n=1 Tax=Aquisphaera insulae TaxID=2712864 RepID=UPI0013EAAEE9|nr:hypothetical protein [Aquisphaera insulae]
MSDGHGVECRGDEDDPVARVVESQARRAISGFGGNLAFLRKAMENGWIPGCEEPGIAEHLDVLRRHLAAENMAEDDEFLLRYALTVPGMQRGIVPPVMVLDPDRNGFSVRRQREAGGQVSRLREVLDLGRAFLPGLDRETPQALNQIADVATSCPLPRPMPEIDAFRQLSSPEGREVASRAIGHLESPRGAVRKLAMSLLRNIACYRFEPLPPGTCRVLRERGILWPSFLFRDAGDDEAHALLDEISRTDDPPDLNHLLLCLAWTRGDVATASFRRWAEEPPGWARGRRVPPSDDLPDAGWWLDATGERVELVSLRCHRLRPAEADAPGVIACRRPIAESCPSCHSPLVELFDLEAADAVLPANAPRRVIGCLYCAMFQPTFVAYRDDGAWEWLAPRTAAQQPFEVPPATRYVILEPAPCPPFATANVFEMDDATTLGGVPMWLQDAEYPRCVGCAARMTFLAQHDNAALRDEGIYYAFYCPACRIMTVHYQQT